MNSEEIDPKIRAQIEEVAAIEKCKFQHVLRMSNKNFKENETDNSLNLQANIRNTTNKSCESNANDVILTTNEITLTKIDIPEHKNQVSLSVPEKNNTNIKCFPCKDNMHNTENKLNFHNCNSTICSKQNIDNLKEKDKEMTSCSCNLKPTFQKELTSFVTPNQSLQFMPKSNIVAQASVMNIQQPYTNILPPENNVDNIQQPVILSQYTLPSQHPMLNPQGQFLLVASDSLGLNKEAGACFPTNEIDLTQIPLTQSMIHSQGFSIQSSSTIPITAGNQILSPSKFTPTTNLSVQDNLQQCQTMHFISNSYDGNTTEQNQSKIAANFQLVPLDSKSNTYILANQVTENLNNSVDIVVDFQDQQSISISSSNNENFLLTSDQNSAQPQIHSITANGEVPQILTQSKASTDEENNQLTQNNDQYQSNETNLPYDNNAVIFQQPQTLPAAHSQIQPTRDYSEKPQAHEVEFEKDYKIGLNDVPQQSENYQDLASFPSGDSVATVLLALAGSTHTDNLHPHHPSNIINNSLEQMEASDLIEKEQMSITNDETTPINQEQLSTLPTPMITEYQQRDNSIEDNFINNSQGINESQKGLVLQTLRLNETKEIMNQNFDDPLPMISNQQQPQSQLMYIDAPNNSAVESNSTENSFNLEMLSTKCSVCGKTFRTIWQLRRHSKVHKERKFACSVCSKTFTEKFNLNTHMLTHTQDRPHQCLVCSKRFRYLRDLTDHHHSHDGTRPYSCKDCGNTFIRLRDLNRHVKEQHLNVKYECKICGMLFKRKVYLETTHMQTHHPNKSTTPAFSCTQCDKGFPTLKLLDEHMAKENHLSSHTCRVCGRQFGKHRYLHSHLKTHSKRLEYVKCSRCPRMFTTAQACKIHEEYFHEKNMKSGNISVKSKTSDVDDNILIDNKKFKSKNKKKNPNVQPNNESESTATSSKTNVISSLQNLVVQYTEDEKEVKKNNQDQIENNSSNGMDSMSVMSMF